MKLSLIFKFLLKRSVFFDSKKHKDKLSKFGLSKKSTFPTGAFVPAAPKDTEEVIKYTVE